MISRFSKLIFAVALTLVNLVSGCSYNMPLDTETINQQFPFLRTGETTREEVRNRMGTPMVSYESERILIYSMIENRSLGRFQVGYDRAPQRQIKSALYHLVLVFGSSGTLERHSLVRVQ